MIYFRLKEKLVNQFKFAAKIIKIFNTAKYLFIFLNIKKKMRIFVPNFTHQTLFRT